MIVVYDSDDSDDDDDDDDDDDNDNGQDESMNNQVVEVPVWWKLTK